MKYPIPRIRMLDGFNEGLIEFEHDSKYRLRQNEARPYNPNPVHPHFLP